MRNVLIDHSNVQTRGSSTMNSIMPDAIKSKQNNPVFERELRRTYDVGRNVVALVLKRGYTGNSLEVIVN